MDKKSSFYQREIDRTPYGSFGWVLLAALLLAILGGWGLLRAGNYLKTTHFGKPDTGRADALFNQAQGAGSDILDQAQKAAANAAQSAADKAANDAKAAATQELLNQKDAAVKAVGDAASGEAQKQADQQQSDFQKYLGH